MMGNDRLYWKYDYRDSGSTSEKYLYSLSVMSIHPCEDEDHEYEYHNTDECPTLDRNSG
jgi:hypothetical protein